MRPFIDSVCITLVMLPYALMMCQTWIHIRWLRFRLWHMRRERDALLAQGRALRQHYNALLAAVEVARRQREESEASSQAKADTLLQAEADFTTLRAQEEPQINAPQTEDAASYYKQKLVVDFTSMNRGSA